MFRRPALARRAIAPPHLSHRQRAGSALRTAMKPHLVLAMSVGGEIREQALALAPQRTRELVAVFDDCRNSPSLQSEIFASVNAELVGGTPIEAAATDAAMRAVRWSIFAEHSDPGYSLACMVEAAQALGMLHALVRPPEELRETLKSEVLSQAARAVGSRGGRRRAERYASIATEIRALYEKWKAGSFPVPASRKGRRLVGDFDAWAAKKFDVHPDKVAEYRRKKRGQ